MPTAMFAPILGLMFTAMVTALWALRFTVSLSSACAEGSAFGRALTRTIVPLSLALVPFAAFAQQGTVRYNHTVTMRMSPEMQRMQPGVPGSRTTPRLLRFDASASIMKVAPEEAPDVGPDLGRARLPQRDPSADEEIYTDFEEHVVVEKREFLGRTFLITGARPEIEWQLTGEQASFLGHLCFQATAMLDGVALEAWFTPEIPVPAGPGPYGGLPGLILILNENGGRVAYVATHVDLTPPEDGAIAPPTRGREVTREEFDVIVEEKMKEMRTVGG